jgi:excinuclease ABC subunit A
MKKLTSIHIHGACQNNLKGFDLEIPLNEFIVVTGVSGSGKSSLAFDTIYAEGQRRYVETFSPYARQFLERMDAPKVDSIDAIPPAIAIRQANSVKTSRSTVGTMTEVNDHLKLLFAKTAQLFCPCCGKEIKASNPSLICKELLDKHNGERAEIFFEVQLPKNITTTEAIDAFQNQGYAFAEEIAEGTVRVRQDRVVITKDKQLRIAEALEAAFQQGKGHCSIRFPLSDTIERFTILFECADCRERFEKPTPNMFSFKEKVLSSKRAKLITSVSLSTPL